MKIKAIINIVETDPFDEPVTRQEVEDALCDALSSIDAFDLLEDVGLEFLNIKVVGRRKEEV